MPPVSPSDARPRQRQPKTFVSRFLILPGGIALAAYCLGSAILRSQASTVVVTVDPSRTYQTIRGWGADMSFIRDLNYVSQPTLDQIIEEAVNDLGLTFLRLGFGYLYEPFNDNADPRNINWSAFLDKRSIDLEAARGLLAFKQKVEANGGTPVFLLNKDWEDTAPSWMTHAEFAENVAATILYYRNQHGIDVAYTSIDNEPQRFDPYTPAVQQAMIKVMGPALESFGLATKIALAEGIDAKSTWDYVSFMQNDASVWSYIGLLNWHLYGTNDPFRSQLRDFGRARGIPTAQTEYPARINDLVDDLVLGGVSYWTRYHIADRGAGAASSSVGSYFATDFDATSFLRNAEYWRFRQFMRYVRPGAVRIDATSTSSSVRPFAFDRSGTRVVVLINDSSSNVSVTVQGLTPGSYGSSQAVGQTFRELGVQTLGPSLAMNLAIPASGILTIYPYQGTNQAPILTDWKATPSFVTLPSTSVSLSASAQDIEVNPLSYAWFVKRRPAGADVTLTSPSNAVTTASGLTVAGEYVFTVEVRDSAGASASRDIALAVYAGNQPPIIAEGNRYFKDGWIVLPQSTSVYGPGFISALDLEGDPVSTSFTVVSQPAGANATFSGQNVSGMTVAGTYTFRFTASDATHTVTRDFNQIVASASQPPPYPSPPSSETTPPSPRNLRIRP